MIKINLQVIYIYIYIYIYIHVDDLPNKKIKKYLLIIYIE